MSFRAHFPESLLLNFLATPSAPFREHLLKDFMRPLLDKAHVPYFEDACGNLVMGARNSRDYLARLHARGPRPPLLFAAHMDHPGFLGDRWLAPRRLRVQWQGGSPLKDLLGKKVWLSDLSGKVVFGKVARARIGWAAEKPRYRELKLLEVITPATFKPTASHIFGGWAFRAPVWKQGNRLYTKGADDLVGCFSLFWTALELYRKRSPLRGRFLALLTRAEEVGFIGATAHLEWLHPHLRTPPLFVSLEASRTLPEALVGHGPVVRLGDATSLFHSSALKVLESGARKKLGKDFQKKLMNGGTCEATTAQAFGLPAVGISVPLGNYHNINYEGGPDASRIAKGPAPEFVDLRDIRGQIHLVHALLEAPSSEWKDPWVRERIQMQQWKREARKLLPLPR